MFEIDVSFSGIFLGIGGGLVPTPARGGVEDGIDC